MKNSSGYPAYPCVMPDPDQSKTYHYSGMTLREYYAGLAMQGIAAKGNRLDRHEVARDAVEFADALIHELKITSR
jgi:hypothetical protein